MTNIDFLLKKYYTTDGYNMTGHEKWHKKEETSKEYKNARRSEANRKHRHLLLEELLLEIPFSLSENQISQIHYWIDKFNQNFKNFHRQSSNETILLAFIMVQRKQQNKRLNVEKYSISKKYNLTHNKFESIQNQLIFELMRTTELVYSQARHVNHEILEK